PWPMPLRPQASAPTPTIQPHRPQPWSLSIGGAGSAFFPKNRPAQAGASVRVSLACRLYDRWSVQGGLGWRTLPAGAFAADTGGYALRSSQLRYAFGYERTSTELSPTALHVLDLPLALRWHPLRQVWAEGGLSLSRLMGVRGQWTQHTSTSLQPDGAHSTRHVWVPERGYRKLWLSPSIGAGWQHGRWSAGLRALGVPADLMPPLVPDAPPRKGWLLNWEIGLNWRIF
ncbi:MAG TPA: hypothetical protein PKD78_16630, partial [Saprospiraceae bacterium]|nr:hypothetical protein [Saprospiraceae bacterium]